MHNDTSGHNVQCIVMSNNSNCLQLITDGVSRGKNGASCCTWKVLQCFLVLSGKFALIFDHLSCACKS